MRGMIRGCAEDVLGKPVRARRETATEIVSYSKRTDEEKAANMEKVHELVAEHSDLVKTLARKTSGEVPAWEIKKIGTRMVRVPVPRMEKIPETYEEAARVAANTRLKAVKEELIKYGQIPGMRRAYEKKLLVTRILIKAHRKHVREGIRIAEIEAIVNAIREQQGLTRGGAIKGADREQIKLLEEEMAKLVAKRKEYLSYQAGHDLERHYQMRDYVEQAAKGRIVEFPSARTTIDEGLEHMRNHQPFLLAGHLGSGKTEMARHMAKLFMIEQGVGYDPATETDLDKVYDKLSVEVFSGAEEASVYDLVGKLKLVGRSSFDKAELAKRINEMTEALTKAKVTGLTRDQVAALILGKSDVTETVFNYGPLGRALRDGRPIIIDEINLMPPEILGRINDIMLRRAGDPIRLQENGEEELEIKPGFAILATCNLGAQYAGIKEVNAAFKSRWVPKEVVYPSVEETYDLILAALLRKDRVRLPPNFPSKDFELLTQLAVVTRETQELFSGQTEGLRFMAMATNVTGERAQLEKSVISTRDLMRKIVLAWKQKDFTVPLDGIIAKNILAAEVFSIDDQKLMTEIFIRRGFFKAWKEEDFKRFGIYSIKQAELNALQAAKQKQEYKDANKKFDDILTEATTRVASLRAGLLFGNLSAPA